MVEHAGLADVGGHVLEEFHRLVLHEHNVFLVCVQLVFNYELEVSATFQLVVGQVEIFNILRVLLQTVRDLHQMAWFEARVTDVEYIDVKIARDEFHDGVDREWTAQVHVLQLEDLHAHSALLNSTHELVDVWLHEALQVRQSQLADGADHVEQLGEGLRTQLAITHGQAVD